MKEKPIFHYHSKETLPNKNTSSLQSYHIPITHEKTTNPTGNQFNAARV